MSDLEHWAAVLDNSVARARQANRSLRIVRRIERNTPTSAWVLDCDTAFYTNQIRGWMQVARDAKRELDAPKQAALL